MKKLIILNHKMSLEYDQVYEYIDCLNKIDTDNNIIICPSNIYLENFINNSTWGVGAQNVSDSLDEKCTGEISTLQLKSLGVEYCIVGHHERVKCFKETGKLINKKIIACLDSNIIPIVCIGSDGKRDNIIKELEVLLKGINHIDFIIFAYEPLGLEFVPSTFTISDDVEFIYDYLQDKYKSKPNIVFGGGVRENNIKDIIKIDKLNGVIIGNVSSDKDKIRDIIGSID